MHRSPIPAVRVPLLLLAALMLTGSAAADALIDAGPLDSDLPAGPMTGTPREAAQPLIAPWDDTVEKALAQSVPEIETGIGPGSALHISHNGSSDTFLCTANFVWTDDFDRLYLGTAGHCLVPEGKTATHGSDADHDPADTTVAVRTGACPVSGLGLACGIGGSASPWVQLGEVAYALNKGIGKDFGLVRIPDNLQDQVRTQLPAWGGPTTEATVGTGDVLLHYGHGVAYGEAFVTRARTGSGLGSTDTDFQATGTANPGDSGSAVVRGGSGPGTLEGEAAVGILTHGIGAAGVGVPGLFMGTLTDTGKQLVADHVGLRVWTLPGGEPLSGLEEPETDENVTLPTGTVLIQHGHNESTTKTIHYNWTHEWDRVRVLLNADITQGRVHLTIRDTRDTVLYTLSANETVRDDHVLEDPVQGTWRMNLEYVGHTGSLSLRIEPAPENGDGTTGTTNDNDEPESTQNARDAPAPMALVGLAGLGLLLLLRRNTHR